MSDNVYRVVEVVGSSQSTIEDAIQNAIARAGKTLRHVEWFEVLQTRGMVADGNRVGYFQVILKIGFRLDE